MMNKKVVFPKSVSLIVLGLMSCLYLSACDPTGGSTDGNGDGSNGPERTGGGNVVGPCTLIGDIRSFEISCTKTIQSFTFQHFTTGRKLTMNGNVNGALYDMNIENQGTKLVGSERLTDKIDLTIDFTDSSTASASLWVAG